MSRISTLCGISLSVTGIILGISASIAFYLYGNSMAVFWAFFSACLAMLNLHLQCLYLNGKLEEWHTADTMWAIRAFGSILFVAVFGLLIWFLFKIFDEHLPVYPIKDSLVITSVWTFMTAKWAFVLARTSHKYAQILRQANPPLLQS